jgi:hypothetical protein
MTSSFHAPSLVEEVCGVEVVFVKLVDAETGNVQREA